VDLSRNLVTKWSPILMMEAGENAHNVGISQVLFAESCKLLKEPISSRVGETTKLFRIRPVSGKSDHHFSWEKTGNQEGGYFRCLVCDVDTYEDWRSYHKCVGAKSKSLSELMLANFQGKKLNGNRTLPGLVGKRAWRRGIRQGITLAPSTISTLSWSPSRLSMPLKKSGVRNPRPPPPPASPSTAWLVATPSRHPCGVTERGAFCPDPEAASTFHANPEPDPH